ncbi:hypothetical protein D8B26_005581 [Coccidioides posadasii str. Silveira]|uniref:uncharacterized protein n=1 Tax=Coccidioides posadasii (strain RMSCC 757 / Silveira) TaxID=443226 RepID=UPI001BEFBCCC|nr:hypothetical protein D8B26_005581 [Coccidioides posadasii str. Silveira]
MQFGVLLFFASVTLAVARVEAVPGADTGTSLQMRAPQCVELYQDCLDNPNCCPPNRCRNWVSHESTLYILVALVADAIQGIGRRRAMCAR